MGRSLVNVPVTRSSGGDPSSTRAWRVLLVDDDPDNHHFLQYAFKTWSDGAIETASASTPAAALALLDQRPFDMMVTDLSLLGGSGLELVEALRQRHPNVIDVILTGDSNPKVREQCHRHGATRFLMKATGREQLRELHGTLLKFLEEGRAAVTEGAKR